jgi:hypothetical protein
LLDRAAGRKEPELGEQPPKKKPKRVFTGSGRAVHVQSSWPIA